MAASPFVTEHSLHCLKRLLLDQLEFVGVYARVKTRPSKFYPKLCFGTIETHSKVASPATPMENHSYSDGMLHNRLVPARVDYRRQLQMGHSPGFTVFFLFSFWTQRL